MSDASDKKKWWKKRWVFWTLWMPLLLCLILGGAFWWLGWNEKRQWLEMRTQLEAEGEIFEVKHFIGEEVPTEENVLADQGFKNWINKIDGEMATAVYGDSAAASSGYGSLSFLETDWYDPDPELGLTLMVAQDPEKAPEERFTNENAALRLLANYRDKDDLRMELERIHGLPYWQAQELFRTENLWDIDMGFPNLIALARFNMRDSLLCGITGDLDGAMKGLERGMQVIEWSDQQSALIGQLVEITNESIFLTAVWQILANHSDNADLVEYLHRKVRPADGRENHFLEAVRSEVAWMCWSLMWSSENETVSASPIIGGDLVFERRVSELFKTTDVFVYRNLRVISEIYLVSLRHFESSSPRPPLIELGLAFEAEAGKRSMSGNPLSRVVEYAAIQSITGWTRFMENDLRVQACWAIASSQIEVARFKLAEGRYPSGFSELVPNYLNALPKDPFDGKPLRWTKDDSGKPLIYSIGPDLTDDGGVALDDDNIGDIRWLMTVQGVNDESGYLPEE